MAQESSSHSRADGGWEMPLDLVNLVEEHGKLPSLDDIAESDVDEDVYEALSRIHSQAESEDVFANEMLLELKRINSVCDGIPNESDIQDWVGGHSVSEYRDVFGSIENAVQLSLAAESTPLMLSTDEYYSEQDI